MIKKPKVRIKVKNVDTPETILRKEARLFDEAFDFYEQESVILSRPDLVLKKIHPRYNPRPYGCKTLRAIYEKLDRYETVQTEKAETVIRRKRDNS